MIYFKQICKKVIINLLCLCIAINILPMNIAYGKSTSSYDKKMEALTAYKKYFRDYWKDEFYTPYFFTCDLTNDGVPEFIYYGESYMYIYTYRSKKVQSIDELFIGHSGRVESIKYYPKSNILHIAKFVARGRGDFREDFWYSYSKGKFELINSVWTNWYLIELIDYTEDELKALYTSWEYDSNDLSKDLNILKIYKQMDKKIGKEKPKKFDAIYEYELNNENIDRYCSADINYKELTIIKGNTHKLEVLNVPGTVSWFSSKPLVASVNKKGEVKGLKEGYSVITAIIGTKKYSCVVTVNDKRSYEYADLWGNKYIIDLENIKVTKVTKKGIYYRKMKYVIDPSGDNESGGYFKFIGKELFLKYSNNISLYHDENCRYERVLFNEKNSKNRFCSSIAIKRDKNGKIISLCELNYEYNGMIN